MNERCLLKSFLTCFVITAAMSYPAAANNCRPTEPDIQGPFYRAGASVKASVGKGYILNGVVRSAVGCIPVKGAQIEFWLAGPDGQYDDNHRATVFTDADGAFLFESNYPPPYFGRPPHIHLRVSARGFETLVTQHYPQKGKSGAAFDIVLIPSE